MSDQVKELTTEAVEAWRQVAAQCWAVGMDNHAMKAEQRADAIRRGECGWEAVR